MGWGGSSRFRLLLVLGIAAGGGVLVAFPPAQYAFYPGCPFHAWTGLLCPGCGGTRALAALLRGQWVEAWRWNELVVLGTPLGVAYAGVAMGRGRWVELRRGVWVGVAALAAGFMVWRNLG